LLASKFFKEIAEIFDDQGLHAGESSKSKKLSDTLNDQKMYGKNGNKSSSTPLKGQGAG